MSRKDALELAVAEYKANPSPASETQVIQCVEQYVGRIVYSRFKSKVSHVLSLDDLKQEGIVGAWEALQKYDTSHKVTFATYAYFRIYGHIVGLFRSQSAHYTEEANPVNTVSLDRMASTGVDVEDESVYEPVDGLGGDVLKYLVDTGQVVDVLDDVLELLMQKELEISEWTEFIVDTMGAPPTYKQIVDKFLTVNKSGRAKGQFVRRQREQVIQALRKGKTVEETAHAHGMDVSAVQDIQDSLGT